MLLRNIKDGFKFDKIIQRLFASWLFASSVFIFMYDGALDLPEFPTQIGIPVIAVTILLFFAAITLFNGLVGGHSETLVLLVSAFVYAFITVQRFRDAYYAAFMIAVVALCLYQLMIKEDFKPTFKISKSITITAVAALAVFYIAFTGGLMALRYFCYAAPNFDFGLFVNMFYNMKTKFLPLVTSERDVLMSHFGVHVSPIWYLLLPFYALFPYPATLQIGQAVIIAIGIIPVCLIAKRKNASNLVTVLLCVAYCFHPALSGGCFYDIHENCFLIPLLLWLFYFFESTLVSDRKIYTVMMYVFAVLVMLVKEDAPLYIAFFAIYIVLSHHKFKHGIALFCLSVAYFCFAMWLLSKFGLGAMTSSRFGSYTTGSETSMFEVAKNIIADPALLIDNIFNKDRSVFLLEMLCSVAFLPFVTKKPSRLILLCPMVVENLMPSYSYQYSIHYQYIFGPLAFIIYASILNATELKGSLKRFMCVIAAIASLTMFMSQNSYKTSYISQYKTNKETYAILTEKLDTIPDNVSLRASTFLLAHVADRDYIYDLNSSNYTDYVAIDLRYPKSQNAQGRFEGFSSDDKWVLEEYVEGVIAIFRSVTYTPEG